VQFPLRRIAIALLLCAAVLVGAPASTMVAGEAGLIVEHGDGSVTYVLVVFPEEEIASIDLLRRSGLSLSTVDMGGLGEAVCTIGNDGCGVSDCRIRLCQSGDPDSPFWHFMRIDASGEWIFQPLGASGTKVRGGEVDLWSWTSGEVGVSAVDVAQIIALTGAPDDLPNEGVYVVVHDQHGNPIDRPSDEFAGTGGVFAGMALLGLIALAGFVLVRRRRALSASEVHRP